MWSGDGIVNHCWERGTGNSHREAGNQQPEEEVAEVVYDREMDQKKYLETEHQPVDISLVKSRFLHFWTLDKMNINLKRQIEAKEKLSFLKFSNLYNSISFSVNCLFVIIWVFRICKHFQFTILSSRNTRYYLLRQSSSRSDDSFVVCGQRAGQWELLRHRLKDGAKLDRVALRTAPTHAQEVVLNAHLTIAVSYR